MMTTVLYAGLSKRLRAFAYDYLLILGYAFVLAAVAFGLITITNSLGRSLTWPADPLRADLLAFMTLVLPVMLYFALQESSPKQATWGKRKAGLRVTTVDGRQPTRKQAFVRSFLKFLPWQIAHTCIFHIEGWPTAPVNPTPLVLAGLLLVWIMVAVYLGTLAISKEHRTPYDWAAGTQVTVNA